MYLWRREPLREGMTRAKAGGSAAFQETANRREGQEEFGGRRNG